MQSDSSPLVRATVRMRAARRPVRTPSVTEAGVDPAAYRAKLLRFNASENYQRDLARLLAEIDRRPFAAMLDVGCGVGTLVERVRARHPARTVDGFDRFDFGGAGCAVADLCAARAPRLGRYDLVTFVHSINHLADLDLAVARIAAALSPGGRLVVINPNPAFVGVVRVLNEHGLLQTVGGDATVVRYLGEAELTRALGAHGLALEACEAYGQTITCEVHGRQVEVAERLMLVFAKSEVDHG